MKNIKIVKAESGRGWYLDVEEVIFQAPLTALELLSIYKMIGDIKEELLKELD